MEEVEYESELLTQAEQAFLETVGVGDDQKSFEMYIQRLRHQENCFLPSQGLTRRDVALLGLGVIARIDKAEIKSTKFELIIPGCTDYRSLLNWLLDHHQTRPFIFVRSRTIKGTLDQVVVPTRVSLDQLTGVALAFGGQPFKDHQNLHYRQFKIKQNKSNLNMSV